MKRYAISYRDTNGRITYKTSTQFHWTQELKKAKLYLHAAQAINIASKLIKHHNRVEIIELSIEVERVVPYEDFVNNK